MIKYTDFGPCFTMEEVEYLIRLAFLQTLKEVISIETLSTEARAYKVRVWWKEK